MCIVTENNLYWIEWTPRNPWQPIITHPNSHASLTALCPITWITRKGNALNWCHRYSFSFDGFIFNQTKKKLMIIVWSLMYTIAKENKKFTQSDELQEKSSGQKWITTPPRDKASSLPSHQSPFTWITRKAINCFKSMPQVNSNTDSPSIKRKIVITHQIEAGLILREW